VGDEKSDQDWLADLKENPLRANIGDVDRLIAELEQAREEIKNYHTLATGRRRTISDMQNDLDDALAEVESLKHDLARAMDATSEHLAEVEKLKARTDKWFKGGFWFPDLKK